MKKAARINFAIQKCLFMSKLNQEEINLLCSLSTKDLFKFRPPNAEYEDLEFVKKWCDISQRTINESINLDYGHHKSDAREGLMAKRAMLTMAKDLYMLYCSLNDGDDLPEWCHYKLATSRKDLGDVADYITSKITKLCLDKNMSKSELRLEAREIMKKSVLEEGFFDSFKNKKKRSFKSNLYKDSAGNSLTNKKDIFDNENPVYNIIKSCYKLSSMYEKSLKEIYNYYFLSAEDARAVQSRIKFFSTISNTVTENEEYGIKKCIKLLNTVEALMKNSVKKKNVLDTRKKKKKNYKNLWGMLESNRNKEVLNAISDITFYMGDINTILNNSNTKISNTSRSALKAYCEHITMKASTVNEVLESIVEIKNNLVELYKVLQGISAAREKIDTDNKYKDISRLENFFK